MKRHYRTRQHRRNGNGNGNGYQHDMFNRTKDLAAIVVMLLNFSGLIWGAATMFNGLETLRSAVTKLEAAASTLVNGQAENAARIRVLEDREERKHK